MDHEFSALFELALARGVKHSELIAAIEHVVVTEFRKRYPDSAPADISVFLNQKTGSVRLLSETGDITPTDFSADAASIARLAIIEKIKHADGTPVKALPKLSFNWIYHLLFWGYNFLYLFFLFISIFGLFNSTIRDQVVEAIKSFGFYRGTLFIILISTPLICIIAAIKAKLYQDGVKLRNLFLLLEVPLVVFSAITFSSINQPTGAVWFFTIMVLLFPLVIFVYLSKMKFTKRLELIPVVLVELWVLLTSTYFCILYAFFFSLIIGGFIKGVGGFLNSLIENDLTSAITRIGIGEIITLLLMLTFGLLALIFAAFLLVLPFFLIILFGKLYSKTRQVLTEHIGETKTALLTIGSACAYVVVVLVLSYQPDSSVLIKKLEQVNYEKSFEARQSIAREIMSQEEKVKQELGDMYNARSRYLFTNEDRFLGQAYKDVFKLNEDLASGIQTLFTTLAYPFVYQGDTHQQQLAADNFQYLFGYPIYEYSYKQIERKEVHVVRQKITANTDYQGLLATVTIEEEFTTNSYRLEEVIYEFSLPEDSVVTDLKLGPNLEYRGVIAPKGAAQNTYQREVSRSRDPALLEQTGPRQYRLRVFPIPSKNDFSLGGKNQKVQFTYVVGATPQGYPLPVYTKKINLDASVIGTKTVTFNGENLQLQDKDSYIRDPKTKAAALNLCNFSAIIPMRTTSESLSAFILPHKAQVGIGDIVPCTVSASPGFSSLARNLKIAILYDVSYANKGNPFWKNTQKILDTGKEFISNNAVDLYLYNDSLSLSIPLAPDEIGKLSSRIVYFGKSDLFKALQSLKNPYDFIIIAPSATQDFLASAAISQSSPPLYIIHGDGQIPAYNGKFTGKFVQKGGKIVDTLQEAVNHFVLSQQLPHLDSTHEYLSVAPYWSLAVPSKPVESVEGIKPLENIVGLSRLKDKIQQRIDEQKTPEAISEFSGSFTTTASDPLTYLVAHAYFVKRLAQLPGIEARIQTLDNANAFATRTHILTPYSSLIALVNEQQQEALRQQAQNYDRYVEDQSLNSINGSINIPPPQGFRITNPSLPFLGYQVLGPMNIPRPFDSGNDINLGVRPANSTFGLGSSALTSLILLFAVINGIILGLGTLIFLAVNLKRKLMRKNTI